MSSAIVPIPQANVTVRAATADDVPFIDRLQKLHSKMVGFMSHGTLAGKIGAGEVIVAEDASHTPVGYCIGTDRYFKHDDIGIIYHLNVVPGRQRAFVGATLLKAMFDRAAYGCRLFCCWCAQDIDANRFWKSMGFVALAYRAGSEKKRRVHLFWQKRIRQGDATTPWWFPSQTTGGAIREDRLVLPIPPGVSWDDEMPLIVLPGMAEGAKQLAAPKQNPARKPLAVSRRSPVSARGGLFFSQAAPPAPLSPSTSIEKPARVKKPKQKNDPKLIAAARELRDRWLEQVNGGEYALEDAGKYDVVRALPSRTSRLANAPTAMLAA